MQHCERTEDIMAKKRQTKRGKEKYPALKPHLNLKTRYDLLDFDYVDQLSDKDKEWLNKFAEEYVNANIDTKNPKKNLHRTKALKKDCYDRNNSRNRCILTRAKAQGKDVDLYSLENELSIVNEDDIIDKIDDVLDKTNEDED